MDKAGTVEDQQDRETHLPNIFGSFCFQIDTFCNSNRLDDRSLTSKTTGWGAVMTGPDRSHTSKMTGLGAVMTGPDRSHTKVHSHFEKDIFNDDLKLHF